MNDKSGTLIHIEFLIGYQHKTFLNKIKKELSSLDQKGMKYIVFQRHNVLLPKLTIDGSRVVGLKHIKESLNEILKR